jgi:hypothetical protein
MGLTVNSWNLRRYLAEMQIFVNESGEWDVKGGCKDYSYKQLFRAILDDLGEVNT